MKNKIQSFKNDGFSIIEVLVVFSMMAITTMVVMRIFSTGLQSAKWSEDYLLAGQLAHSLLAKSKITKESDKPVSSWHDGGKYRWQITEKAINAESSAGDLPLKEVTVRVVWGQEPSERQLKLVSLMLSQVNE